MSKFDFMCGGIIVCEFDNVSDYFYLPLTQFLPILILFLASRYQVLPLRCARFPTSIHTEWGKSPGRKIANRFSFFRHFVRFIQQFQTACVGDECASVSR